MSAILSLLRVPRLSGTLARFRRGEEGMALVEFAMVLPVMVLLYLGGVAVTQGVMTNRKVVLYNYAIGDLAAQTATINAASDRDAIFAAASAVMAPYDASATVMKSRISSVRIKSNGNACVEWSLTKTGFTRAAGQDVTAEVPADLRVAGTWLIFSETEYKYTPVVGVDITGVINMKKALFLRPRVSSRVLALFQQPNMDNCKD